ncbi:hypothetical protein R6Q59_033486 [Mikania micrantha]
MKINSCFVLALLLLVSCTLADEKPKNETTNREAEGATDKVEPAYGGGNWGGGGGGGGGGCSHGCCYHGRYGCQRCCSSPEEAKAYADINKAEPAGGGGGGNWGGGGGGSWGGGGGGGCRHGCCSYGSYGCQRCCFSPEEANAYAEYQNQVGPAGGGGGGSWGGGGGGGGCRHGCCYKGRYGCERCCFSPEEANAYMDKNMAEPAVGGGGGNWGGGGGGSWGGGGGGGCRHGCCSYGRYGCQRCCLSPEEAKAYAEKQGHP